MTKPSIVVCALYRFIRLDSPESLQQPLLAVMMQAGVRGTILLAKEGFNGTVAGSREGIDRVLDWLRQELDLEDLDVKESLAAEKPFRRSRVKLKREIVTMGVPDLEPGELAGTYVEPEQWNALVDDPEVLLVDTRNEYEVRVGTFRNALNPGTGSFREFPGFVANRLDPARHRKVAMFCTGGIRCEKSTAYLRQQGFEEVYHLKGGILNYLARVPESETRWQGECFVFDERVTVDHRLEQGSYEQCHACRMPISTSDRQSEAYVPGASCPHCIDRTSDTDRTRFLEREKQVRLAEERGAEHIGPRAMPGK